MKRARSDAEIAEAVLGYFAVHPQAMDTTKGITEWWIMPQQIRADVVQFK